MGSDQFPSQHTHSGSAKAWMGLRMGAASGLPPWDIQTLWSRFSEGQLVVLLYLGSYKVYEAALPKTVGRVGSVGRELKRGAHPLLPEALRRFFMCYFCWAKKCQACPVCDPSSWFHLLRIPAPTTSPSESR